MKEPKFPDCTDCKYFSTKFTRPECHHCGAGEFFERKINTRAPSNEELMDIFKRDYHE